MSTIKGLRTLVRLKARRVAQQEAAVQEGRRGVQAAQSAHEAAQAEEARVRDAEQGVRGRLLATTTRATGFHADDVITYQLLLQEAERATADAARNTQAAAGEVQKAKTHLAGCDAALRRGQQQHEATQERLDKAMAEAERAMEDAQDEEAEETTVARMLAASRAAAKTVRARAAR